MADNVNSWSLVNQSNLADYLRSGYDNYVATLASRESPETPQSYNDWANSYLREYGIAPGADASKYDIALRSSDGTNWGGQLNRQVTQAGQEAPVFSETYQNGGTITPGQIAMTAAILFGGSALASGALGGAGAGAGVGSAGGAGTGTLGAIGDGVASMAGMSPEALGLTGSIGSGMSAADLAYLSQALPGAVEAGAGLGAAAGGSSLMPSGSTSLLDAAGKGALKGAATGGIKGAINGQNPFEAALKGAVGGAISGGIGSIGQGSLDGVFSGLNPDTGMNIIPDAFGDASSAIADNAGGGDMGWGWDDLFGSNGATVGSGGLGFGDIGLGDAGNAVDFWGNGSNDLFGGGSTPSTGDWLNSLSQGSGLGDFNDGGGWLDAIVNGGKGIASAVGGGKNLAGLIGAALGATQGGKSQTTTAQNQIDPRMAQYLYGTGYGDTNSLLGAAQKLWQDNKSGLNPTMQQGLDMQRAALTDPAYGQAFQQMRSLGTGLMGGGVAGNPFSNGQLVAPQPMQLAAPPPPAPQPMAQAGGVGGLLGGAPTAQALQLISRGRGLIG